MANFDISKLSPEARELLQEAVQDPDGQIVKVARGGGVTLRTNGRQFIEEGSARSRAVWEGAFNELRDEQLVEDVGRVASSRSPGGDMKWLTCWLPDSRRVLPTSCSGYINRGTS